MSDLIGRSLGRYHILEQLGEGGMAIVYKAYDTRLETEVAVKVIRTDELAPKVLERALKRFERESKALAKLNHLNIVKVTDYGEYDGRPYLVMPYLSGGTLKHKLTGRPMPWQESTRILLPIVRALDYAHRQGMTHRDVKPSNILITEDGDPLLTDFGIVKIVDEEATMDLTGTSATVGTPEYMAPEQVMSKTVDHRADIYALGVVFYEMVTGRKLYTADTPMAVLFKHASEPLPSPRQFAPDLPTSAERVLLKALAKNPADRYQSMAEMAVAMEGISSGQTKKTVIRQKLEPTSAREDEQKSFFIKGTIVLGIVGVSVLLGLGLIGSRVINRLPSITPTTAASLTQPPTLTMPVTATTSYTPTIAPTLTPSEPFSYTLQEGDSLDAIAQRFNLGEDGVLLILDYNPEIMDQNSGVIFVGQTITIPPPGTKRATPLPVPPDLPRGTLVEYRILPGDTLAGIALLFNSQPEDILAANPNLGGDANALQVGLILQIPVNLMTATPTLPPTSTPIIPTETVTPFPSSTPTP